MKNTLENKARFFAQYWGQKLLTWKENNGKLKPVNCGYINDTGVYLELTAPSQITDEHAIEVAKIIWLTREHIGHLKEEITDLFSEDVLTLKTPVVYLNRAYDYLRSKGYALPFMGLSVEKQIEYGWVELKEV